MKLISKVLWSKVAAAGIVVTFFVFCALFASGIATVFESARMSRHTSQVLSDLAECQAAITEADQEGREVLLSGSNSNKLGNLREAAIARVVIFKQRVSDNPEQSENAEAILVAFHDRVKAQDAQIKNAIRSDGTLTFPSTVAAGSILALKNLDHAFDTARMKELSLLFVRDQARTAQQFQIIQGMILSFALLFALALAYNVLLMAEYKKWKAIADTVRSQSLHDTEDAGGLTSSQVEILLQMIERGYSETKAKSGQLHTFVPFL